MVKFQWEKAAPLQRGHLNLGGKNRKENIQVNSRYLEKKWTVLDSCDGRNSLCKTAQKSLETGPFKDESRWNYNRIHLCNMDLS